MIIPVYYQGQQVGEAQVTETSDFIVRNEDPEEPIDIDVEFTYKSSPKIVKDFQQRVIEERAALQKKVHKLVSFMMGQPPELPDDECKRLGRQLDAMSDYLYVLDERIKKFE